jgi:hypothetical protein
MDQSKPSAVRQNRFTADAIVQNERRTVQLNRSGPRRAVAGGSSGPSGRERTMSRRRLRYAVGVVLVLCLVGASVALASRAHDKKSSDFRAQLIGYNEAPSLNTPGHADLALTVTDTTITFTLKYADLTGAPAAAHIHVGQVGVNGGVSVFFCGGGGKPACPLTNSGTVTGTIAAADVVAIPAQGFVAGDIAPVIAALRAGFTYANMHTAKFPGGEIRGQIFRGHGEHGKGDH